MSDSSNLPNNWKTPNELIKLSILRRKKEALQARVAKKNISNDQEDNLTQLEQPRKRKNPFAKSTNEDNKRQRIEPTLDAEDTLLQLIGHSKEDDSYTNTVHNLSLQPYDPVSFANLLNDQKEDDAVLEQNYSKHLPIDWSLKTKLRLLCKTPLPSTNIKTNQVASGLTGFVRCLDSQNSSTQLDTSQATRFHQGTMYWQHPSLPWLTLFPRNSKQNSSIQLGDSERRSLAKDWSDSFLSLYQLLRARQCPYFYVCANSFTALFRAAGVGGRVETHAFLTPTSRGLRNALKKEDIEYVQLFKKESQLNKSDESNASEEQSQDQKLEVEIDDDDLEEDQWLESLGVDEKEIKKISSTNSVKLLNKETSEDFTENSLILVEGVDCQGLFNFLLNAKSTVPNIGRLAGVPPTLLAPVAFPGATLRSLQTRSSKVRVDGVDYYSIELKGVILPHILHYYTELLAKTRDLFSATLSPHVGSLALAKAAQKLIEDSEKENVDSDQIFGKENLSDCGLPPNIIGVLCKVCKNAARVLERMYYSKGDGFAWS